MQASSTFQAGATPYGLVSLGGPSMQMGFPPLAQGNMMPGSMQYAMKGYNEAPQAPAALKRRNSAHIAVSAVDPTDQESDLMERMEDGVFTGCEEISEVPLVSLGCSCGPKLSFKAIGRGAETLPFDWARTRVEGLLHFLSEDFDGFFDNAVNNIQYLDEKGTTWTAFRSPLHSFWHDDPREPAMRERYTRRIERLFTIDATEEPVLFVRSVAQSSEIPLTAELLEKLQETFGEQAKLLLIVDFQGQNAPGPCTVDDLDDLLVWYFDTERAPSTTAPYGKLVGVALHWAIGESIRARRLPNLNAAHSLAKPTQWGMHGAAKVPAFI